MKKVLISGYVGFGNFGDEAIFYALTSHLKKTGNTLNAFSGNPKKTFEDFNVESYYFKNIFQILKAIIKTDVLISGGGSLLQDKTSNFSLYYYLFILILAKLFFKKTVIFAQGIEAMVQKNNENLLKFVLKTTDFVSVRDKNSQDYLKKLGIDSILLSDPVYSILQEIKISDKKEGLIVQLRKTKNINEDFLERLAKEITKNYKGSIKILPLQDSLDKEICEKFKEILANLDIQSEIISKNSISEIIETINNSKYMISTRLHGAIVSNALKTNTFTLNYDEKLKTLSEELHIQNINLDDFSFDELEEKLKSFFNNAENFTQYRKFDWEKLDLFLAKN